MRENLIRTTVGIANHVPGARPALPLTPYLARRDGLVMRRDLHQLETTRLFSANRGAESVVWQSHDGRRASRYSGLVIAFDDIAFNALVHIRQSW